MNNHQFLKIYTVVSHTPFISPADEELIKTGFTTRHKLIDRQRIKVNGEDYIDEFGRYVYLANRVGLSKDRDLRYEGTQYSDSELFTVEYVENDSSDRRSGIR